MAMLTDAISEELVTGLLFVLIFLVDSLFDDATFKFGDDTFVLAVIGQPCLRLIQV